VKLEPTKGMGLKVVSNPEKGSPFINIVEKGNIVLKVAGKKVNTISKFESIMKEFAGQKVRVKVNVSGKTGIRPKLFMSSEKCTTISV